MPASFLEPDGHATQDPADSAPQPLRYCPSPHTDVGHEEQVVAPENREAQLRGSNHFSTDI